MAISRRKLRGQIKRAIAQLPQEISLKRVVKVGPEEDYEEHEIPVATFDSFLDRSESKMKQDKQLEDVEGKVDIVAQIGMLVVWEESFEIKPYDYFILDGLKHVITYPKNNYNIYWDCDVEVVMNG